MLGWALTFFIVAIIAGVLGFGGIASGAASIAKIIFFLFLILLVISLVAVEWGLAQGPAFNYSIFLLCFQREFHTSTAVTGKLRSWHQIHIEVVVRCRP